MKVESDIVSSGNEDNDRKPRRKKSREASAKNPEHNIHLPDLKIIDDKDSKKEKTAKKSKKKSSKPKQPKPPVKLDYEPGSIMPLPMDSADIEHEISLHQPATVAEAEPAKPVYESPAFSVQDARPPHIETPPVEPGESATRHPTIEEAQARLREELRAQAQEVSEQPELPEVEEQPATGPVGYEIPRPQQTSEAQPINEEPSPSDLPPGHRLVHSAWHSIEVGPDGRPVENPSMAYGQAFAIERHPENRPVNEPDDVTLASGQLAVGDTTDIGTENSEPDLNTKKSRDFTKLLNAKEATLRESVPLNITNIGDFGLLVILALVILAIVFALIL